MNSIHRRALDEAIAASIAERQAAYPQANAFGTYYEILNGELVGVHTVDVSPNLLPTEGIIDCLDTWLGATAKKAGWYIGIYANAVNPASGWTAANVAANAGEITSQTEGYSETTRPQFVANAAAAGAIDNVGHEATFSIVGTGDITVNGALLISDSAKGGTNGKLASATRFGATRTLQNGDSYKIGYRVTLTSA
jgi:hypothetical protein